MEYDPTSRQLTLIGGEIKAARYLIEVASRQRASNQDRIINLEDAPPVESHTLGAVSSLAVLNVLEGYHFGTLNTEHYGLPDGVKTSADKMVEDAQKFGVIGTNETA